MCSHDVEVLQKKSTLLKSKYESLNDKSFFKYVCSGRKVYLNTSPSSEPEPPRRVEGDNGGGEGEDWEERRRDLQHETRITTWRSFGIFNTLLRGEETFNASRLGFLWGVRRPKPLTGTREESQILQVGTQDVEEGPRMLCVTPIPINHVIIKQKTSY